jgi:hypothetical protein
MARAVSAPSSRPLLSKDPRKNRKATDPEVAAQRLAWMNRWADFRGYDPHEGQYRLHCDTHRHRTLRKGRRGGGTTAAAFEVEVECQLWGGAEGEADIGLFAPTGSKTEILFGMVYDSLVKQGRLGKDQLRFHSAAPGHRRIETAWGSRIIAFSLESESPGEGYGFRLIVVDETQLISEKTWRESIRPTLSDKGGRALFVGKAAGAGFRGLCGNALKFPGTWSEHAFPSRLNPIVPETELLEARAELPDWLYRQEYEAEFADMGDAVFAGVARLVDDSIPLPGSDGICIPRDASSWYVDGWDLAKKRDRTVGITLDCAKIPYRVVAFWRGYREPWPKIQARMELRQRQYDSAVWPDATGLGDAVLGNLGIPLSHIGNSGKGFIFTARSKEALLTNLQKHVEDGAIRIPRIPQLITELEDYRWDDEDLETDCVMALALAAWGAKQSRRVRVFVA